MAKLKPQNTYKHLLNFVSTSASRPVLQGFHFLSDGSVEATNAHKFLRLLNNTGIDEEKIIDPKTLLAIDGDYPNVDHLINKNVVKKYSLSQTNCIDVFNFLKSAKKDEQVTISFDESIVITLESGASTTIICKHDLTGEYTFIANATYLKQIFDFTKDITDEDIELGIVEDSKFIIFRKERSFIAMLFRIITAENGVVR